MALMSDLKTKLQIVYSVSLSVSSLLQSQQAPASELASCHTGLKLGNPSSAHLGVVAHGDMDKGLRILQSPCGSTWASKSPVRRNSEVYGWWSEAQRWHSHCGPCGEVESSVRAALWVSSVWVIPLLCLIQTPQTKLEHGTAGDTLCEVCEILNELNDLLSCSSEE